MLTEKLLKQGYLRPIQVAKVGVTGLLGMDVHQAFGELVQKRWRGHERDQLVSSSIVDKRAEVSARHCVIGDKKGGADQPSEHSLEKAVQTFLFIIFQ